METLLKIQTELKVPKGNYNSFGKYKYRSAEDILEAVKPILLKHNATLTLSDEIIAIGNKIFLKATARIGEVSVSGYAETSEHKGMSAEQTTGTASSYARKYALNGLFLIDETEADADSQRQPTPADLPWLNKTDPIYPKIVEAVQSGARTIDQIKLKYKLSKEIENAISTK